MGRQRGFRHTEKTKEKIRKKLLGRTFSQQTLDKMWKNSSMRGRKRELHPAWKGGRVKHSCGYILILQPDHPRANSRGYVGEQIIIMEKYIGRFLMKGELVHHINGDRTNNDIRNLRLFCSNEEHMQYHNNYRRRDEKGRFASV
jgi:hypothetical protein